MSGVPLAAAPAPKAAGGAAAARPTRVRHVVLWLTVLAYMITYMDRVVISVTGPMIQQEYGIGDRAWGWVLGVFQIGYALFQIPGGWLGDRFGPRRVLTAVVVCWSSFTALTTATWSIGSLIACRFLFGCGEAGAFPNATRSLSRWMLPGYILHWSGWNAAMYVLAALSALGGLLFLRIDASRLLYRDAG